MPATGPLRVRTLSSAGNPPPLRVFDRAGARAVDRDAIDEFGLPGVTLMENAAASLALVCFECLARAHAPADTLTLVLCGPGNNGGDGFACARRLLNAGRRVAALTLGEPDPASDAGVNLRTLRAMRSPAAEVRTLHPREHARAGDTLDALIRELGEPALLVDALLGTGLDRPLEGAFRDAALWLNARAGRSPIVAADIPTGLDCDTGAALGGLAVRADATVTFAGLKRGFLAPAARSFLGEVVVADIGAPRDAILRHGEPLAGGAVVVESAPPPAR